jgi:hypothetical protein
MASGRPAVDAVWGDRVPNGSVTTIRTYVGHLWTYSSPLAECCPGCVGPSLRVPAAARLGGARCRPLRTAGSDGLPLLEDERFAEASVSVGGLGAVAGPVLADLADYEFVQVAASRLDELRLAATEARIEADLARPSSRVGRRLDLPATENPLREGHGQRMLALYRAAIRRERHIYRRLRALLRRAGHRPQRIRAGITRGNQAGQRA